MLRTGKDGLLLDVLVRPRASRVQIGPVHDRRLKLAVTAPPVDGAANAAVVEVLAKTLGCAKRDLEIVSGAGSRQKTVAIHGLSRDAVVAALGVADPDDEEGA
ncbi:DUF167 domain-containing protein [Haliangium sp.]|uniref:DUF167 domain-containing protein n=1 Tax=Haliangium sp. TaxID=2663208 RepID=UPI003D0AE261